MKLIIDVKNILYRRGWRHKNRTIPAPSNFKCGPTYGFFEFLSEILYRYPTTSELVLACDPVLKPAIRWRQALYPAYKNKPIDPNAVELATIVKENLSTTRQMCGGISCRWLEDKNFEADDLIADYVSKLAPDQHAVVVSQDKDMLQLCAFPNVEVAYPKDGSYVVATHAGFASAFSIIETKKDKKPIQTNITPQAFVALKCIIGDGSDNITGLIGVGPAYGLKIIHAAAEMAGGMEHLPLQPAQVLQLWINSLPQMKNGGPKWAHKVLHENSRAFDVVTANYALISLINTGRPVTLEDSFIARYQEDWLKGNFRMFNFHELLNEPLGTYLFEALRKLDRNG